MGSKFPALSKEEEAEQFQWLTLSTRFPESIAQLNETLKSRTYLLNTTELSLADSVVYSRVLPVVSKWTEEEIKTSRHVVRWIDLVQNNLSVPEDLKIKVDLDLAAPREIKAKPEKKKAAEAPKEAAAAKPEKKEAKADKKKAEKPAADAAAAAAAKGEKKEKAEKKKKEKKPQPAKVEIPITPAMIDLRVGHIQKAIKHPDADALYVSTIDMGDEEGPRTVCSGLVKYFPLEAMQDRYVVVVANLKPVTMRGIKSSAMVLCASNEDTVEFVNPPAGSKAGDKIFFESFDGTPEAVLNPKKKIWEQIQPGFSTTEDLSVVYRKEGEPEKKLVNKEGKLCKVNSLVAANVR